MLSLLGLPAHLLRRPSILRSLPSLSAPGSYVGMVEYVNRGRCMSMQVPRPGRNVLDPNIEWLRMSREAAKLEQVPANPYSGRSVRVFNGNLTDAFRKLDGVLGRNKVRAQVRKDERHEQKGAKRRRLSRERWRKRFAHEVRLKVQLVQKIRRRGA